MKLLDFYKKNTGTGYEKLAFEYLVNDLLKDKLTGTDKQRELTGLNMEETMPTNFVPSMFYIFLYQSKKPETIGKASFYDVAPLILCTQADATSVSGINFNFIPNDVRAAFIDIITESYPEYYNKNVFDENPKINEALGGVLSNGDTLAKMLVILKSKLGVDLGACVRHYDRGGISDARMIEIDMWKYIPFLSFRDSVRGVNLAKIQTSVIQTDK